MIAFILTFKQWFTWLYVDLSANNVILQSSLPTRGTAGSSGSFALTKLVSSPTKSATGESHIIIQLPLTTDSLLFHDHCPEPRFATVSLKFSKRKRPEHRTVTGVLCWWKNRCMCSTRVLWQRDSFTFWFIGGTFDYTDWLLVCQLVQFSILDTVYTSIIDITFIFFLSSRSAHQTEKVVHHAPRYIPVEGLNGCDKARSVAVAVYAVRDFF